MALGLNIFSALTFILISQGSTDPLHGQMRTTQVNLHVHTVLCTQFQRVHGSLETLKGPPTHGEELLPYAHVYPLHLYLLLPIMQMLGNVDAKERWLLPQGACDLVGGGGLVHEYVQQSVVGALTGNSIK